MKRMDNYLQSPLRGVLYRKPRWWASPKGFNLMCLFNATLRTQQWHQALLGAERSGWSREERQKPEAVSAPQWVSLKKKHLPLSTHREKETKVLFAFEVSPTCSHAETHFCRPRAARLQRVGVVSWPPFFWSEHPHFPPGDHLVLFLLHEVRGPCGLGWPIEASLPWNTLVGGQGLGPSSASRDLRRRVCALRTDTWAPTPKLGGRRMKMQTALSPPHVP